MPEIVGGFSRSGPRGHGSVSDPRFNIAALGAVDPVGQALGVRHTDGNAACLVHESTALWAQKCAHRSSRGA
jgi:hypothetical protein